MALPTAIAVEEGLTDDTYFTLTTAPTHGTATIHPESGNWTYTPNANYFGNDAFQVTVTDDLQGTTPALLQITVTPVDDPAIITGDFNATIAEDGVANGDLNAVDIEGLTDDTYFTLTTAPTHGTATIHPESGNWTYTPNANYFGNDGFQVTVTDDLQGTTPALLQITVTPVDDPAIITGDFNATIAEDGVANGDLNAVDIEGLTDDTYFTLTTAPTHGIATIHPESGNWTYTPNANYFGNDGFQVTVTDDLQGTTPSNLQVTVTPVDDPAIITGDFNATIAEDGVANGDLNAVDIEGLTDDTYFTLTTAPTHGTATIHPESGNWTYTPNANYFGNDGFQVTVTDDLQGTTPSNLQVTVTPVDDPAIITGDFNATIAEDGVANGDLNAVDIEGLTDDTYFTLTTAPTHGIATIHPESGNWTYTPNANYFGNDGFQVTVTDDLQGTTPALLQITVTPVDDPAIITGDFNATIAEDGAANGDLNAVDIEGLTDDTYFTLTTAPTHGTATIHPESGNWTYTPNANYFGNDAFQVTVTDDLQGTTPALLQITVNPVDDPAIITGDFNATIAEDGAANGDLNAVDIEGLTDDTYFTLTTAPTHGIATIHPESGNWTYTPNANYFGNDGFQVTVTDDLQGTTPALLQITVNPVDDPAIITGDFNATIAEDGAANGDLNAVDIEGLTDDTYFTLTTAPTHGTATIHPESGNWTYTPNANYFGNDGFQVTVTDDLQGTTPALLQITVTPVDDPAIITGDFNATIAEDGAANGDLNAVDIEGLTDDTYFTLTTAPTHGIATIHPESGNWTYTPNANYFGNDGFQVTVTDDLQGTTPALLQITVTPVDDPAIITGDFNATIAEDGVANGDLNAVDIEGLTDDTYFTLTTAPTHGIATIHPESGNWTYTPNANYFGNDGFQVTVTDDLQETTPALLQITVTPVDDPAIITGDFNATIAEDGVANGDLNAVDIEGLTDDTYFTLTTAPTHGIATIHPESGNWTYTPNANYFGNDAFQVTVTDDLQGTTPALLQITVTPVDDPAIITGDFNATIAEDGVANGDLNAVDIEGLTDDTYFTLTTAPTHGIATIHPESGNWTYTPNANYFGNDAFQVTVTDDLQGTTPALLQITVTPVDDPAIITGDFNATIAEDGVANGDLNAVDIEGLTDDTYFTLTTAPTHGIATIHPESGNWTYTPNANYFGNDAFQVTVTDDLQGTTPALLQITVTPVDDPAIITGDFNATIAEDGVANGDLNAVDIEGLTDDTYFTLTTAPTHGIATIHPESGNWTYTPNANYFGNDAFQVTVTDDLQGTTPALLQITVTPVDDPAIITGDFNATIAEDGVANGD